MTVYVDALRGCTPTTNWRWHQSAHLLADTEEELHKFAQSIGLRRQWFQSKSSPHYDLNPSRYAAAMQKGAVPVDRKTLVALIKKLRDPQSNEQPYLGLQVLVRGRRQSGEGYIVGITAKTVRVHMKSDDTVRRFLRKSVRVKVWSANPLTWDKCPELEQE